MTVKINRLELENVKRVHAVTVCPSEKGLTVIGGNNNQGKTSILDAISWALGGDRKRPQEPQNRDSVLPPTLRVELSNGLIVERNGKNSTLTVTDPSGQRAGQRLLDSFIAELALDLPKFLSMNAKEKAQVLLQVIGKEEEITALEREEERIYNERTYKGREYQQKKKYADELPYEEGAPEDLISASELIQQQQKILLRNAENQKAREQAKELQRKYDETLARMEACKKELQSLEKTKEDLEAPLAASTKTAEQLQDESTWELEQQIADVEKINDQVRTNQRKEDAIHAAERLQEQYDALTQDVEAVRKKKLDLLQDANLPLRGLSIVNGELAYLGDVWDAMSGSTQLKVATAIVQAIKPECGFVLLDKLEQFDLTQLAEFGAWLEEKGLQVIGTRVSTGEECQLIIEDGFDIVNQTIEAPGQKQNWQKGVF